MRRAEPVTRLPGVRKASHRRPQDGTEHERAEERQRWIESMPNVAGQWVKSNPNVPARDVLAAWMNALRAAGEKPARAWDGQV